MQDYLLLLLKASWQAAVLIVLVLAARWVFGRRLKPQWRFGLWFLVVIRLALPWTIHSPVSLFNFLSFPNLSTPIAGVWTTPEGPGSLIVSPTSAVADRQLDGAA